MTDQFHILEILSDGVHSIESKKRRIYLLFLIPAGFGVAMSLVDIAKVQVIADKLFNALAIFTGFLFTLMVYVSDKANNAKNKFQSSKDHSDLRLSRRLSEFYQSLIKQISYTIVMSTLIIVVLLIRQFEFGSIAFLKEVLLYLTKVYDFFVYSILIHFLIFLGLITSSMYAMFIHETSLD